MYRENEAAGFMNQETVRAINSRLFFQSGTRKPEASVRPWQYVEMEYSDMGIPSPFEVPRLENMEDAEIWMCLDERVNRCLRLKEAGLAG